MGKLWEIDTKAAVIGAPSFTTVHGMFWHAVTSWGDEVMVRQKELGVWREWTWRDSGTIVSELAHGLAALGLLPGERVSILANTVVQWVWCDFAILTAGGVANGIYPTDSAEQVHFLCEDSATVIAIVEDEEQLDKLLRVRADLPLLRHIVVIDARGLEDFSDPMVIRLDALRGLGADRMAGMPGELDRLRALRTAQDMAILVYTSGTTGRPKGVMLSHQGLIAGTHGALLAMPQDGEDERICFLPLCHVAERVLGIYAAVYTGAKVNFVEDPATVAENMREIAPTVFFGVPRIWEKFYSSVTITVSEAGRAQQAAYRWAIGVGYKVADLYLAGKPIPGALRLQYRLAGIASLDHVRRYIGIHRCRFAVTAAAPISPDLIRWYLALGIPLLEAWGQTECTGVATLTHPKRIRPGSVGQACGVSEVRVDAATGELLVRGPNVFMGYLNQPEKTSETLDADGWLHTGDVGTVDADGFFRITDRMKDIIITAGGKNVTPSEWENELKFSPYVVDAVVIGDRRPYLTAIVMIDRENVEKFAQDREIPFTNYASLTRAPGVRAIVEQAIGQVNAKFARVEQIKKFWLLETELSAEDEELTPTMKLKRRLVQAKYSQQIEAMYEEVKP